MNTSHKFVRTAVTLIGIFSILFSSLQIQPMPVAAQGTDDGIQRDFNSETGKVTHITGTNNEPITVMGAMSADMTSTERSDVLVERFAPEFGLTEPSEELIVADESQPEADRVVTKYQQVYQGVPVLGGELIVNASDKGELYSLNGEVSQGLALDTTPAISVETAIDVAKQGMTKWYGGAKADYQHTNAALYIFDESLLRPSIRPTELVWKIEMTAVAEGQPIRELVMVSAKTGNIPLHFNQIDTMWENVQVEPIVQYDDPAPTATATPPLPTETPVPTETPIPTETPLPTETAQSDEGPVSIQSVGDMTALSGTVRYVYPGQNFQNIINSAVPGDTILTQAGTYTYTAGNVINVTENLTILGGWDNTWTVQNGNSIIDGQNARNAVLINGATVTMDHFTIQNGAAGDGGGIYLYGSTFTLTNSNVNNNKGSHGAGIFVYGFSTLNLINSTVNDNVSTTSGGGIFVANQSSANIQYSTIAHNSSNGTGGGLSRETPTNPSKQVFLKSNIIASNSSVTDGSDCYGYIDSSEFNIISNSTGCSIPPGNGNQFNVDSKISATTTGSPAYFTLSNDSPAIDAANSVPCPTADQRGMPRPRWNGCDIGSYEYAPSGGLGIISGSDQSASIRLKFASPLKVSLVNSSGNPIPNTIITFSAPASGASGTFDSNGTNVATATTDANGQATSPTLTANNIDGLYTVVASAVGVSGVINFNLKNSLGVFVATTGSDLNTCLTAVSPCATINAAIAKAYSGDAIWVGQGTYKGSTSDPIITVVKNLVISGGWNANFSIQNGQTIIDGENLRAGFKINPGNVVELNNLTIQKGYASQGAGIYNEGVLTLKNVAIVNNVTYNDGAGIYQRSGQINAINVTISNNTGKSSGGGIYVYEGVVSFNNSTITQNIAADPNAPALGGGLSNFYNRPVTIRNTIIAGNGADIVPDCRGQITSWGHNLIGYGDGCMMTPATGDMIGALSTPLNAKLGNLLDNGGSTFTHALLTGSPAIDAGDPATCATTDQRGVARPQGAACDIGAYEGSVSQTLLPVIKTYTANHSNAIPGNLVCDQPVACGSNNADANSAHQSALGTYKFYLDHFGRISLDDNNMPILSTVQYENGFQNAFWTGAQMILGDGYGFANADDIMAHELTHGVTQYESNLLYIYQSGAINESFSDLWGEYFDQTNGIGNDTPSVKWLIGEDVTGLLKPARNMANPLEQKHPDRIGSTYYYKGEDDNGGVHRNSGVNNKAVFLMVDGGTFNGITVQGLGWEKTAAIYYEAQVNLLGIASNYSDLYYALQQACTNVGFSISDCFEVKKALDAVQMNSPVTATTSNQISALLCPTGMTTNDGVNSLTESFDDASELFDLSGWKKMSEIYSSSSSAMNTLGGDGVFQTLTMKDGILIKPNSYLHFHHAYDFEIYQGAYYDGGVVEYSLDNGNTWIDAGSLYSAGAGYSATLATYTIDPNPLKGRRAFAGTNFPYYLSPTHMVSSRFNLSTLVNKVVKFRFAYGTDMAENWRGWFIDDVKIYQCVGAPAIPTSPVPANNTLLTDYTPLLNWTDSAPALHHYYLQIATDNKFTSLVYDQNDLTTSEFTIPIDLTPDTIYYWRVSSFNAVDGSYGWSPTWTFRTALLPPAVVSPTQGEHILHNRPSFNWDDVPNAAGYTIQISTSNTFVTPIIGSPMLSNFTPATDLPKGLLYWRVQTRGTNGPSAWSEVRSINALNPPPAPALKLLAANILLTDYTPTLTWTNIVVPLNTTLLKYQIQVDDDSAFGSPTVEADTGTTNSYTPPADIPANTKYYWRVRAVNTLNEEGNWSTVGTFRTALLPPVLTSPVDNFDAVDLRPVFDWEDVPGVTGYTLQVSTLNNFATLALNVNSAVSNYTPTANLPAGVKLYWRVLATGTNGPSAPSLVRSINSPATPGTPLVTLPLTNALVTDYTPSLKWSIVTLPLNVGFGHYQVQVDDDPTFTSPEVNDESLISAASNQLLDTPVSLAPNTKFYWRVRAISSTNKIGNWSAISTFRTALLPPVLTSPVDNFDAVDLRPVFDWEDVPGATGYTLQVSTLNTFATLTLNVNSAVSNFTPTANLPAGVKLYWRVLATGTNGPSAPSLVRSINSPATPGTPLLTLPAANALVTDYTPTLKWSIVTLPLNVAFGHYQVQVDEDPTFASPEVNDESLVSAASNQLLDTPSTLTPNTKYSWRVRAVSSTGKKGNWSTVGTFRTALTPPVLTTPDDNFDAEDLRPVFQWDDVNQATGYTLQVSTLNTFATLALNVPTKTSDYTPLVNLPAGVKLYWRVLATGTNGPSAPSNYRSIQATNPPSVPLVTLPLANALTTDYTPTLKWSIVTLPVNVGFGHYQVQVDEDPTFASPEVNDESLVSAASNQLLDTPSTLTPNTKYSWRVRAVSSTGKKGNWSTVGTFRTALTPPVLTTPDDNFDAEDLRPVFQWDDVNQATGYTLQVSTLNTFATLALNVPTKTSDYTPLVNLPAGVKLYWRVLATGTNGPSAPSLVRSINSPATPGTPLLTLPAANALVTDYTPTLKWSIVTLPLNVAFGHYQVQVDEDPTFASPEVNDESLVSAASNQLLDTPSTLTPNTKYSWRVRAVSSTGKKGNWSTVGTFRTALTPPVLTTPDDNFDAEDLRPVFQWDDVNQATGYTLQVSTLNTFATLALNVPTKTSDYTPLVNLPAGVKLYWRVLATGTNGPSAPSLVRSINSPATPGTPLLTLPAANALVTDYTPTLKWSIVTLPVNVGFGHYQVQVDEDPTFASPEVNDESLVSAASNQLLDTPSTLTPNTKYSWRVRAVSSTGKKGNWSTVGTFRTALTPPVLTTPDDNFDAVDLRPVFDWEDVPGATGYTLQVSTLNTFATLTLNVNSAVSNFTPTANLPAGVKLYWRVLATGTNGPSAPSLVRSINSPATPGTPLLTLPAANALVTDYTPTLKWSIVTLPLNVAFGHYQVQVDEDPTFASPEVNDESLVSAASNQLLDTPSTLTPNTKYSWRVRAVSSTGKKGNWSTVGTFRTALTPPVLTTPDDNFDAEDLRPVFQWDDVNQATGYTLQVSTLNTFATLALNVPTKTSDYTPLVNLPAGVKLYWRVLATGTNGPSAPSNYRSIQATNPPSVPLVTLPLANALTTDYTPTLKWSIVTLPVNVGFGHYQVQVDEDPTFASPEVNDESLVSAASNQLLDTPVSLAPNTKFYWRVRAFNAFGESNLWSTVGTFRTALTPPVLTAPLNATAVASLKPAFTWNSVPMATGYQIQVSTSSTFATTLVNATTVSPTYTPVIALPSGYVVFWRVRTNGANGPSDWTTTIMFTTP